MFFNIGPLELVVLAFVGLVVLGPERLPGLARDAGRLLRGLREMATGARTQLREELGPEFADIDLRSLNPRTAITRALLGDDADPTSLNPGGRIAVIPQRPRRRRSGGRREAGQYSYVAPVRTAVGPRRGRPVRYRRHLNLRSSRL